MDKRLLFYASIPILFITSCASFIKNDVLIENVRDQNSSFPFSITVSESSVAKTGDESLIVLEDGASIIIPYNSIEEDVSIKLSRNHENMDELPLLDEGVILLSDVYNFQVTGELYGPVDLVIPFNPELIPNSDGVLVFATPTETGWDYVPVIPVGNKIIYSSKNLGAHLIAWHFVDTENEYLEYKLKAICDPRLVIQAFNKKTYNEGSVTLVGSILPFSNDFSYQTADWLKSFLPSSEPSYSSGSLPIKLTFNNSTEIFINSENDGSFQYKVNVFDSSIIKNGLNHVDATVECDSLFGSFGESVGFTTFNWGSAINESAESNYELNENAILLPNFIGQPIEMAKKWLQDNNINFSWIDGDSFLEIGVIYEQAPIGDQYIIPHRNSVVFFNTTETIPSLPLTYVVNECVENFYRLVSFDEESNSKFILNEKTGSCEGEWGEQISSIEKIDENSLSYFWISGENSGNIILNLNSVDGLTNPISTDRIINWLIDEISWSEDWGEGYSTAYEIKFVGEETISILGHSRVALVYEGEYEEYVFFTHNDSSIKETRKSKYYFDKITGFNLRVEHFKWLNSCTPDCSDIEGELTGSTVLEIVETDWDFGN